KQKIGFFHEKLSYKPNYDAAEEIIKISRAFPDVQFLIAGRDPGKQLSISASQTHNVNLLGFVRDLELYVLAADFFLVPIRHGGGTRLKLLEYLCSGKPLIATKKAAEGLELPEHSPVRFYDSLEDATTEIRKSLAENGQPVDRSALLKWVSNFSWDTIADNFERQLHNLQSR